MLNEYEKIYKGKRVLVTGANGFVGNHLMHHLKRLGAIPFGTILDADPSANLSLPGFPIHWTKTCRTIQLDIRSPEQMQRAVAIAEPDFVFHLAAMSQVTEAERLPRLAFETHVMGTVNLLDACRIFPKARIVISSSDKAYGKGLRKIPFIEADSPKPGHPYDTSKAAADLAALSYAKSFKQIISIARCANIYGPGDLNFKRVIPGVFQAENDKTTFVIRSNGKQIREYMFIDDAIEAFLLLALIVAPSGEIFNFGGFAITTEQLALLVIDKVLGYEKGDLKILGKAKSENPYLTLSSSKAYHRLAWKSVTDINKFIDNLFETSKWYKYYFGGLEQ